MPHSNKYARSNHEKVEALDNAAAQPDRTQLHSLAKEAAGLEDIAAVKYAISLGAQPSEMIIPALSLDKPDILACLLDAGLEINYRIPGYTGSPLTGASAFAKTELVKTLLARGADPNLENCGWGRYHLRPPAAAAQGWMKDEEAAETIRVLLDGGARWEGSAALQLAAGRGRVECVKVLVGAGADVNEIVGRVEEKSALRLAEEKGCEEVVRILKARGAKE